MGSQLEFWADSFHEGNWACLQIAAIVVQEGGRHSVVYEHGFIPVHSFAGDGWSIDITVYGSYRAWEGLPEEVEDLLRWGKPDLVAYDPASGRILFAVEETAATPTGNQALQRCERQVGASLSGIPFWYLLSEFGMHVDGGVRRDSIWPTVVAFKLTAEFGLPSVVLHYSDSENPEDYEAGSGLSSLFRSLTAMIANFAKGSPLLDGLEDSLVDQYSEMARFIDRQWPNQIEYLPGEADLLDPALHRTYAELATGVSPIATLFESFLRWPTREDWVSRVSQNPTSGPMLKHDDLALRLEQDIDRGRCYVLSNRSGSKPQKSEKVREWIADQEQFFRTGPTPFDAVFAMNIDDFPKSPKGLRHVSTSPNVFYLYDRWGDILDGLETEFPRLRDSLDRSQDEVPGIVYVSNSLKPGRIFGDPYTGQIAAYGVVFGKRDPCPRKLLAYFPHQVHTQAAAGIKERRNKGKVIMREMTDLLVFHGGIAVDPSAGRVI